MFVESIIADKNTVSRDILSECIVISSRELTDEYQVSPNKAKFFPLAADSKHEHLAKWMLYRSPSSLTKETISVEINIEIAHMIILAYRVVPDTRVL